MFLYYGVAEYKNLSHFPQQPKTYPRGELVWRIA